MKNRLDKLLVDQDLVTTRSRAKDLINRGKVSVNGKIISKSSFLCDLSDQIVLSDKTNYVSRGALKLLSALDLLPEFVIKDQVALDMGASTGGFTQVLLEKKCKHVYAVDVGSEQLNSVIRENDKVTSLEKTNIRDLTKLPEPINLCVGDLSFISLTLVLEVVYKLLNQQGRALLLFKPQFEVGKLKLPKDGVVKNKALLREILVSFKNFCETKKFGVEKIIPSKIVGKTGNQEFFFLLNKDRPSEKISIENMLV